MPTYKSSVSIEARPEEVFTFLSDVRNLPTFVEGMAAAEPLGGEAVRVTVDIEGEQRTGEAWFRIKEGHHPRIEFGVEGPHGYRGWLEVDREGQVCSVTAEVQTERPSDRAMDESIDRTLFALKDRIEGSGT